MKTFDEVILENYQNSIPEETLKKYDAANMLNVLLENLDSDLLVRELHEAMGDLAAAEIYFLIAQAHHIDLKEVA